MLRFSVSSFALQVLQARATMASDLAFSESATYNHAYIVNSIHYLTSGGQGMLLFPVSSFALHVLQARAMRPSDLPFS
jgi:hypothetical protein